MYYIIEGIKAFRSGKGKRNCPHSIYLPWVRWTIGWELAEAVSNGQSIEFVERYLTANRTIHIVYCEGRYMFDTVDHEMYESIVKELG